MQLKQSICLIERFIRLSGAPCLQLLLTGLFSFVHQLLKILLIRFSKLYVVFWGFRPSCIQPSEELYIPRQLKTLALHEACQWQHSLSTAFSFVAKSSGGVRASLVVNVSKPKFRLEHLMIGPAVVSMHYSRTAKSRFVAACITMILFIESISKCGLK